MIKDTEWQKLVEKNLLFGHPTTKLFRQLVIKLMVEELKKMEQEKEELEAGQIGPQ